MQKQPGSRTCFVCGRENPIGLKMEWYNNDQEQKVIGTVTVPKDFNSYPGIVHGGIVSTILDETSWRAILLNNNFRFDNFMVTTKMEVTYRHPTPCEEPLTVVGWVQKRTEKRAVVEGEIRLSDGTVTASCNALLLKAPKDVLEAWRNEEEPYWKVYE